MARWFAHPDSAVLAAGVCLAASLAIALARAIDGRRRRRLLGIAASRGAATARPGIDVCLLAALAAIGVGLASPWIGFRNRLAQGDGIDVVLLLDVSRSMEASDNPPSRLARARRLFASLLERLGPHDRAALAAYAGRGILATPLTLDHEVLREMLPALDGSLFSDRSSRLDRGLEAAVGAFDRRSTRSRWIVLASDGENDREAADGVGTALRAEVSIAVAAVGSDAGATIPADAGRDRFRDARGEVVVSRRDLAGLGRMSDASGGHLVAADRWGEVALDALLGPLERTRRDDPAALPTRRVRAARLWPFALVAFGLLAAERGIRPSRTRRDARTARTSRVGLAMAALIAAGAGRGIAQPAPSDPADGTTPVAGRSIPEPRRLIELGLARAEAGSVEGARRALRAAALTSRRSTDAALAFFDLGVLELDEGELAAARDAFFAALAFDPDDLEARFNLEWTVRALAANERPAPPPMPASGRPDDAANGPNGPGTEGGAPSAPESPPGPPPPAEPPEGRRDREPRVGPEPDARETRGEPGAPPERPRSRARRSARPLSPEALRRQLGSIDDDLGRSLRSLVADGESEPRPGGRGVGGW